MVENARISRAAQAFDTPNVHDGDDLTETAKKIRKGVHPPIPAMAGMIDRHFRKGGTLNAPIHFFEECIVACYEAAGIAVTDVSVDDAVAAETEAQGDADRFDVRAAAWRSLSMPEKYAYRLASKKDAIASNRRYRAVCEQIRKDEETERLAGAQKRQLVMRHA